jgi:uncharacterized protein
MRGVAASVLLVLVVVAASGGSSAQEIPTVYLYVNDLASPGVLLYDEEDSLTGLCFEIDDRTTAEVAILIVNTTLPYGIDTFAVEAFAQNAIGKAGKDNGVLVLVSVDERQWRIEVGYGLEGILNDAKVGRFGDDYLSPALVTEDYYGGLWDVTYAIGTEILNDYDPGESSGTPKLWILDWWMVVLLVALIALAIVTRGRFLLFLPNLWKRGGFGGGRSGGGGAKRGF